MKYTIVNGYLGGENEKFKGKMFCPFSNFSCLCGENCPHFDYRPKSYGRLKINNETIDVELNSKPIVYLTCGGTLRIIDIVDKTEKQ